MRNKWLTVLILSLVQILLTFFLSFAQDHISPVDRKKRDPFVALASSDGKIKSKEELFPTSQKKPLSINIVLTAIIWDERNPLAMINSKVYSKGKEIAPGLTLEEIHPNSIVLNDSGNLVTIQLRKATKNE